MLPREPHVSVIEGSILDFRRLDLLAREDSIIHRLDPRTKVLVTLAFILVVVSFDRYAVNALLPFAIFPVALMAVANLPTRFIAGKVLTVSFFAVAIGILNPLLDRQILIQIDGIGISGGWLSFISILLRSALTVTAALILTATTGFGAICQALERLGMPTIFARQLTFMYRYLFVLAEESQRMSNARELRSCRGTGMGIRPYASMVGHLLLRTWERAERVHRAMLCRGYKGNMVTQKSAGMRLWDLSFLLGWITLFVLLRMYDVPRLLGHLTMMPHL